MKYIQFIDKILSNNLQTNKNQYHDGIYIYPQGS